MLRSLALTFFPKRITIFLRLFADFERSNPFIPSIYLDTDHLAQRIHDPMVFELSHQSHPTNRL